MFRIAICDDDSTSLMLAKFLTTQIMTEESIEFDIALFRSPHELLKSISDKKVVYDVLLLDILMEETSGIEVAQQIRQLEKDTIIIFVSSSSEYAIAGYRVNALRYLTKPLDKEQLREAFHAAIDVPGQEQIRLTLGKKIMNIRQQDVMYIESDSRGVCIHFTDHCTWIRMTMSEIENLFDSKIFVRSHRTCIINVQYVVSLIRYRVTLKNKVDLPISQSYYAEFSRKLVNYLP